MRSVLAKEGVPDVAKREEDRLVPKDFRYKAGEIGNALPDRARGLWGLRFDFGYNAVVDEEMAYAGIPASFSLQSDIVCGYLEHYGSEEQKRAASETCTGRGHHRHCDDRAGAGNDLQAIRTTAKRQGNHYVLNGSKTYITNGQNTDLALAVAKTDPDAKPAWKGMSIILVESDRAGFAKGRKLDKIGQMPPIPRNCSSRTCACR